MSAETPSGFNPARPRSRGSRSSRRLTAGRRLLYRIAIPLAVGAIRLYWWVCRVRIVGAESLDARLAAHDPSILCYWHRHQIFCWSYIRSRILRGARVGWLISGSVDGEVPTGVARAIGGGLVFRGSSTSGGAEALRAMVRAVKRDKVTMATTPDGPRGPEAVFKEGIVKLAQISGAPIVPIAWAARRAWVLRTWDHFVLPKPFTRIVTAVGDPIYVPRDADAAELESLRLRAQDAVQSLFKTAQAQLA